MSNKRNIIRYKCLTCGKSTIDIKSFGSVDGHCRPGDLIYLEEKRYYTPKLDEFHVGFEYEYLNHFGKDSLNWTTEIIENDVSMFHINNLLASCAIRVKYLNKEDIESLEFKLDKTKLQGCKSSFYIYNNYELINDYMGDWFTIRIQTVNPSNKKDIDILFHGIIKNKSELKTVLNKLNIYG